MADKFPHVSKEEFLKDIDAHFKKLNSEHNIGLKKIHFAMLQETFSSHRCLDVRKNLFYKENSRNAAYNEDYLVKMKSIYDKYIEEGKFIPKSFIKSEKPVQAHSLLDSISLN